MGLDQYVYALKMKQNTKDRLYKPSLFSDPLFRFSDEMHKQKVLIHDWRKHPDIHGWMEEMYISRGGTEIFNCVPLYLTEFDIECLETSIINKSLPKTSGFFFGESLKENYQNDMEFIEKAKNKQAKGFHIFYDSWW